MVTVPKYRYPCRLVWPLEIGVCSAKTGTEKSRRLPMSMNIRQNDVSRVHATPRLPRLSEQHVKKCVGQPLTSPQDVPARVSKTMTRASQMLTPCTHCCPPSNASYFFCTLAGSVYLRLSSVRVNTRFWRGQAPIENTYLPTITKTIEQSLHGVLKLYRKLVDLCF